MKPLMSLRHDALRLNATKRTDCVPPTWVLLTALVVGGVTGCGDKPAGLAQAAAGGPDMAPEVIVASVEERQVTEHDVFTGRLEAVESVEIRPRISGHIQEVRFRSGQMVKQGDVLFVIDPRWHQAEFDRTAAQLKSAQNKVATAERENRRAQELLAQKALSDEEAESRTSRLAEARAALSAAQAAHASAKLDLEFTEVRAPISGRVSRALVTAGNHVSGVAGMTTVLTTLVSVDPVYVYVDMNERAFLRFQELQRQGLLPTHEGQVKVEVGLGNEEGFPYQGWVESLDNRLDASSGSILLRVLLPNPRGELVPGLFARVRVPSSATKPGILVSDRAIGTDQSLKFVLTVTSTNTAEYRPIKLGPIIDGQRLIREGLRPGEQLIVNGLQRVRPGMPVKPVRESASVTPATGKQPL